MISSYKSLNFDLGETVDMIREQDIEKGERQWA